MAATATIPHIPPTADGTVKTLNDPYVTLVWNNDIELPHSFRLTANAQWATKGDYNNFSITAQRFNFTLGVQRDFNLRSSKRHRARSNGRVATEEGKANLRRLGMLTLDVCCVDVLNTNPARRTFLVNLNWKFNEARSKYRGSGAGEKQKARM